MLYVIKTANEVTLYCTFYKGIGLNIQITKLSWIQYCKEGRIGLHIIPNIQTMALVALKTSRPIVEIKQTKRSFKNLAGSKKKKKKKKTDCLTIHTVQVVWKTKHCLLWYAQDQVSEYQNINFQNRYQSSATKGMWSWRVNKISSGYWEHPNCWSHSKAGNFFAGWFNIKIRWYHLNKHWEMNHFLFISLMVLKLQTGKIYSFTN